jgi:TatD DNase family protein
VGGSITYARANKTREALAKMPLESLLLETDAPDMPLQGFQGAPNSPLKIINIARALADLRHETIENVARQTTENAHQLFNLTPANSLT